MWIDIYFYISSEAFLKEFLSRIHDMRHICVLFPSITNIYYDFLLWLSRLGNLRKYLFSFIKWGLPLGESWWSVSVKMAPSSWGQISNVQNWFPQGGLTGYEVSLKFTPKSKVQGGSPLTTMCSILQVSSLGDSCT